MSSTHYMRLLPWPGPEGKPCFVSTDGSGYVSRLADQVEAIQLGMGADLLDHAESLLGDSSASKEQLRFLGDRLSEALRDGLRIAHSRGARLQSPRQTAFDQY
ncbi:hypothetical protein [Streptomyces sp. NPDC051776]|uniref:hypothetical protein n=1 Tax=Streptomyces sp. NPDC051776 TaxID=3155414 RepID=UPI003444F434